jgi:hypothetical protein
MRSLIIQSLVMIVIAHAAHSQDSAKSLSPAQRRMIPYTNSRGTIVGAPLALPDSLGGNHVVGYINMDVRVTKDGGMHGYRVRRIEISPDTLHWFVYSAHTDTPQGDSLFAKFIPWLETYYRKLRVIDTERDSLFLLGDSLWYNHIIDFGSVRDPKQRENNPSLIY